VGLLDLTPPRVRGKVRRKITAHREDGEQAALFRWAELSRGRWPELALLFAVPNGAFLAGDAAARARQAGRLKRQGLRPGVPDVALPVARGGFHGLFVEMKAGKNKASEDQRRWIDALRAQGYLAEVCVGWEAARELVERYLRGSIGKHREA
jgi:hypothetical protein